MLGCESSDAKIMESVEWVRSIIQESYTWSLFIGQLEKAEKLRVSTKDSRKLSEQEFSLSDLIEQARNDAESDNEKSGGGILDDFNVLFNLQRVIKKNKSYREFLARKMRFSHSGDISFAATVSDWSEILQSVISQLYPLDTDIMALAKIIMSAIIELSYINDCACIVNALKLRAGDCGEMAFLVAIRLYHAFSLTSYEDISFLQVKHNSRGDDHVAVVYKDMWIIDAWNKDYPVIEYNKNKVMYGGYFVFNKHRDCSGKFRRMISGLYDELYDDLYKIKVDGFCDFSAITPLMSILFEKSSGEVGETIEIVQQAHKDAARISFAAARDARKAAKKAAEDAENYIDVELERLYKLLISQNGERMFYHKKVNVVDVQKQVFKFILTQVQRCNKEQAILILQQAKESKIARYPRVNKCVGSKLLRVLNQALQRIKKLPVDFVVGKALDDLYFYGYNYKSESRPNRFGCCLACKPGFFNSTLGGKVDSEFPFDCLSGLQSGGIDVFANRD